MIISKTPYRVSFIGGGTDYPTWYREHKGAVISTTIDKYCYVICRYLPCTFHSRHVVVWSYIEAVQSISEILHPAVRAALQYLDFDDSKSISIYYQGDLPARAGMGSSSTFTVGLLHALTRLKGQFLSKRDLAQKAIFLEQDILKESVGSQDQIAAAYGGLNLIELAGNDFSVIPLNLPSDIYIQLQKNLLLFYIGSGRFANVIAADIVANIPKSSDFLQELYGLVYQGIDLLEQGNLDDFGYLLHRGWELKKELSKKTSSSYIDNIYETAIGAGALGGKLLGAGGTGFMLFYVPEKKQSNVLNALHYFNHVNFSFEKAGTQVILDTYNNPLYVDM